MSLFRHALVAFATLLLTLGLSTTAQAEIVTTRTADVGLQPDRVVLLNHFTARCLSVQGNNNYNGAPVFQYDCLSYADQFWYLGQVANGTFRLRNQYTERCAAVQGKNNFDGAPAYQFDCLSYPDQYWHIVDYANADGVYQYSKLHNAYTGRCLAVHGESNVNGARAFQANCVDGYRDQRWVIHKV